MTVATAVLALPPDLESQVRSGNITRSEAEQLYRMSDRKAIPAVGSTQAPAKELPAAASRPQSRPRVNEKALLARAEQLIDGYSGDRSKLSEAKNVLEQVLAANPRSAPAYVWLSRLAYKSGYIGGDQYEPKALRIAHVILDQAFKLDPRLFDAHIAGAYLAVIENDLAGAKKLIAEAEKIRPGAPELMIKYAQIANKENNPDEAIAQANRALSKPLIRIWKTVAYQELLTAYKAKNDYKMTGQSHLAILALDPTPWAKVNYALFLGCAGCGGDPDNLDYDKAIQYGESALKEMDFPMARTTLGKIYFNRALGRYGQGRKNLAISDFRQSAGHYKQLADQKNYQRVQAKMQELNLGSL